MKKILVTGGAGYIGSHTVLQLIEDGYQVTILDNLERGHRKAIDKIEKLTNTQIEFHLADLRDSEQTERAISITKPEAIIHFASYKDVGEADKDPEKFYKNNFIGTFNLLSIAKKTSINKIIFSSTSAVYGDAKELPITEESTVQPKNAYGHTKSSIEWMLQDYFLSFGLNSVSLRYFNAAGAHPSGEMGEDPKFCGNVLPMIMQTLVGEREKFLLFGNKFATKDGTQERDYIHIMDLATAHIAALRKLDSTTGAFVYNLGTGQPTSVKSLINLSEKISSRKLTYEKVEPRSGDPVSVYCDPSKANKELNWKANFGIEQIIKDQWNWVKNNPQGYR